MLELKDTFHDDGKSGMHADNRTEYLKMLGKAENGEIDVIVIMKLDRLGRNVLEMLEAFSQIANCNCTLFAGDFAFEQTPTGELMRLIMLGMNQYYPRRVASDVIKTDCNIAKQGKTVGGIAPYGLKTVDRKYYIDDDKAPAIRTMFERIAEGKSYQSVIKELTESGYYTNSGEKFSYSTLNAMLRNEKYYGTYIYNREGGKKKKHRVLLEHIDEVRVDDNIEPIISKDLFDKVQAVLDKRKTECRPHINASNFILTGKLFCKECGSSMSGSTSTKSGRNKCSYRNYSCPKHLKKNGGTCSTLNINSDYIENAVKSIITDSINQYFKDKTAAKEVLSCLEAPLKEQRARYSRQIADLERNIHNLMSRAAKATEAIAQRYEQQVQECIDTQDSLNGKITDIDAQISTMQSMTLGAVQGKSLKVGDIFTSNERARELVALFIERINIDEAGDDIEIVFRQ